MFELFKKKNQFGRYVLRVLYVGEEKPGFLLSDGTNVAVIMADGAKAKTFFDYRKAYAAGIDMLKQPDVLFIVPVDLEGKESFAPLFRKSTVSVADVKRHSGEFMKPMPKVVYDGGIL